VIIEFFAGGKPWETALVRALRKTCRLARCTSGGGAN